MSGPDGPRLPMFGVVFGIGLYCTVSLSVVFLNRHLFAVAFPYPVFVTWCQQVIGLGCFVVLAYVGTRFPRLKFFPWVKPEARVIRAIWSMSLAFVGMITFSNICLKHVQVSTYQTARSLTLLFNLVLSTMILGSYISRLSWCSCLVVIFGFVVGSLDPSTLSAVGVAAGAISSLFQAYYAVSIKRGLHHVGEDTNVLLFYTLLTSSVLCFPAFIIAGEANVAWAISSGEFFDNFLPICASGVLGICLTFATYYCVQKTSPITFTVTGYAKACVQTLFGIVLLHEVFTMQSIVGILLTLAGSFWYSRIKIAENRAEARPTKRGEDGTKSERIPSSELRPMDEADSDNENESPDEVPLQLAPLKDPNPN